MAPQAPDEGESKTRQIPPGKLPRTLRGKKNTQRGGAQPARELDRVLDPSFAAVQHSGLTFRARNAGQALPHPHLILFRIQPIYSDSNCNSLEFKYPLNHVQTHTDTLHIRLD